MKAHTTLTFVIAGAFTSCSTHTAQNIKAAPVTGTILSPVSLLLDGVDLLSGNTYGSLDYDDPSWRSKFAAKLKSGQVPLKTIDHNLKAYKAYKHKNYLYQAENLATTDVEKKQIERSLMLSMGSKLVLVDYTIQSGNMSVGYKSKDYSSLWSGKYNVEGAYISPRTTATVKLNPNLPMKLKYNHTIKVQFSCKVPRSLTSGGFWAHVGDVLGQSNRASSTAKSITLGAYVKQETCHVSYGSIPTSVQHSNGKSYKVTGDPIFSHSISSIK